MFKYEISHIWMRIDGFNGQFWTYYSILIFKIIKNENFILVNSKFLNRMDQKMTFEYVRSRTLDMSYGIFFFFSLADAFVHKYIMNLNSGGVCPHLST